MTASTRSCLVGNRRKTVALPTPARSATSVTLASRPRSANTSAAAATMRPRLRAASVRSVRSSGRPWRDRTPRAAPRRGRRDRVVEVHVGHVAPAQHDGRHQHAGEHERDADLERGRVAVDQGRGLRRRVGVQRPCPSRVAVAPEAIVDRIARPERAADLLGGGEQARCEPLLLAADVRRGGQRQRRERVAHADRHQHEAGQHRRRVGAVRRQPGEDQQAGGGGEQPADQHRLDAEAADERLATSRRRRRCPPVIGRNARPVCSAS